MAYRFVLDVPPSLEAEARRVVEETPDARVERAERVTEPRTERARAHLTVVAGSPAVVDALQAWVTARSGPERVDVWPTPNRRVRLSDANLPRLKTMLEPVPDVGVEEAGAPLAYAADHVARQDAAKQEPPPVSPADAARLAEASAPPGTSLAPAPPPFLGDGLPIGERPVLAAPRTLRLGAGKITLHVANLQRAERYYHAVFEMDIAVRARWVDDHWEPLPPDYDWDEGIRLGALPQIVLMRHEPLELALVSAGRGAIRPEPQLVHVAMQVPSDTLRRLRAQALVRSHPVLADRPHEFVFRDPFGIVWHLSDVAAAAPAALGAGGGPAQERGTATP